MRVFIGVQAPEWLKDAIALGRDGICASTDDWTQENWVPRKNLHMTVKFMGDIPEETAKYLPADLAFALRGMRSFALPIKYLLHPLGGSYKTTLLMSTFFDPKGDFSKLLSIVEDVACTYGIIPDSRPPFPHVTWARSKRPLALHDKKRLNQVLRSQITTDSMHISELNVFSSVLTKKHPQYKVIGSIRLSD